MEGFLYAAKGFLAQWDAATATIYVGCMLIYLKLCRLLDAEKMVEQRLGRLEEAAANDGGDGPADSLDHPADDDRKHPMGSKGDLRVAEQPGTGPCRHNLTADDEPAQGQARGRKESAHGATHEA